ncbi:MAG: hypothetical protein U5L96_08055 [Owenweeksia sp.]|nr:hypothetical protein [Owenweeksia sp.]
MEAAAAGTPDVNGSLAMSDGSVPSSLPAHGGAIGLGEIDQATQYNGNNDVGDGDGFTGSIMEMAYYNDKSLNAAEREALFSYLGLKYGISISHDYISAGSATTIWDNSANSGYNSDIAGFGRDDQSELNQKQGITANSDGLVSMALGSFSIDNASNGNTFSSDEQFLLWGNNDGNIADWTNSGAPTGRAILGRTWKYEATGSFGNFEIEVPNNGSGVPTELPPQQNNVYLLVDDDPDFSSGGTQHSMTLSSGEWEYTHSANQ